jgi:hypothetical protein
MALAVMNHSDVYFRLLTMNEFVIQQGVPGRNHEAKFRVVQTSSTINLVLLMIYIGTINL